MGRPKDKFVGPHLIPIVDKDGNVIANKCKYCDRQFIIKTSVTRIKAHLGGVSGHDVTLCEMVIPAVKEAAKKAMPSSSTSTSSRPTRMMQEESTPNITHHLGYTHTQQLDPHQNSEFCPLDPQQPDLQERLQEIDHLLLSSSQLSQSAQYIAEDHEGFQPIPNTLNPISLWAQQTHERQNLESLSLTPLEPQYMLTELQREVREMQPYTPQSNENCSTQETLVSQHLRQQHAREDHDHLPDQELLQDAAGMDSAHDATTPRSLLQGEACLNSLPDFAYQEDVPMAESDDYGGSEPQNMQLDVSVQRYNGVQLDPLGTGIDVLGHESPIEKSNLSRDLYQFLSTILNDPQLNMNEMVLNTPQSNDNCSVDGILLSPHPMQQHPREPYQDVLQDAPRMDSMHGTSIPQDILQRGEAYPNSSPHSAHQGNIPIAGFDNLEGSELQHHMQENLQEDQRIDCDLIPSRTPQLQHTHIVSRLESSYTPTCPSNQTNEKKRKLLDRSPPVGKKLPPLESKFQGPTFNKKVDEIINSLDDDSISRIGVYGMGGSGKTTIMRHIHNQLLEEYIIPFTHVIWVTVSQEHTISKLQQHLANWLDLTLACNGDQVEWAATLYEKMENMCYALILDDVWGDINLEEVGIPGPSKKNMCKLILTTRLQDVCHKMKCDRAIFLDLLSQEEAEKLFVKSLGDIPEKLTTQSIMKEIVKECARLPLAIVVVARGMRGKFEDYEWSNALESLQDRTYDTIDEEKKVIRSLEFSFKKLSKLLQQCLLYCALYPNDFLKSNEKELIKMLIIEGTIGSKKSLKSAYDHVRTILKNLENACLLTRASYGFEMHDLIRDMCLYIMGDRCLVKSQLKSPPDLFEYKEAVEKISLFGSEFEEIPMNMMPNCPKLSTFLLLENKKLTRISDSFFTNFPGLKVLNLSGTSIQVLPSSVTNLVSLNALVLRECRELRHMPCLTPLKELTQLDLFLSGIEEAPEGLEELVNLTYLDLKYTHIKTPFSSSILANLVKLQHLKLPDSVKIIMKDVKELKKLEVLKAVFANWEEFSEYVNSGRLPLEYQIEVELTCLGASYASMSYNIIRDKEEGMVWAELWLREDHNRIGENRLSSEVIGKIPSPEIVRSLWLLGLRSEPDQGETRGNGELKGIFGATVLFPFLNLVKLYVYRLDFTKDLISTSCLVVESSSSPKVLLPCFQNLQELTIESCKSLESILVSTANPTEEEEEGNNPISFPNLQKLNLRCLPNLRSICDGTLNCPSIESILVHWCPELKRLPLQVTPPPVLDKNNNSRQLSFPPLPPLSSLKEIKGESGWWESLEWDQQPHAKPLLQPYFKPW